MSQQNGLMKGSDKKKLDELAGSSVTGVKGDAEAEYRAGNVNLTAANVGAAASDHTHSQYALTSHNHDSSYSSVNHNHDSAYAAKSHSHSEYASATHNHDSTYAAKSHSHTEYAAASHGNHVPTPQTANNAVFLRNDNSWQTVTPANIGAAASSHTHSYAASSHTHGAGDITSGTLAVARGGTGQTTLALARNAMGLGNTTGAVPVANGGTGATTAANALTNLGAASSTHNHDSSYAAKSHTHDYAASSHNHDSVYAKLAGAAFTGAISGTTASFTGNVLSSRAFGGMWACYVKSEGVAAGTATKTAVVASGSFYPIENWNFNFYIDHDNTAATVSLNINSTGAKQLKHYVNGSTTNVGAHLKKGHYYCRIASGASTYQVVAGPVAYYQSILGV